MIIVNLNYVLSITLILFFIGVLGLVLNRKNNLDKKLNVFKTGSEVLIIDEKTID